MCLSCWYGSSTVDSAIMVFGCFLSFFFFHLYSKNPDITSNITKTLEETEAMVVIIGTLRPEQVSVEADCAIGLASGDESKEDIDMGEGIGLGEAGIESRKLEAEGGEGKARLSVTGICKSEGCSRRSILLCLALLD